MNRLSVLLFLVVSISFSYAQEKPSIHVIGYYSGGPERVAQLAAEKLTHIIFSFGHLKGNQFDIRSKRDSVTIQNLVLLKKRNPALKIMLSLGGWGGCETCSPVFSTEAGRHEFALSVLRANQYFKTDGIDLDWEYPAISGFPGHAFMADDRKNFTGLVKDLRTTLGKNFEISFAAGGFQKFIDESIDWKEVILLIDRVNLMTYDLIHGGSTQTGHHTALYSTKEQQASTDYAVQSLLKSGVPANKLVIGAAFYGRMWEGVAPLNNGLYQGGKFKQSINYKKLDSEINPQKGFTYYWDDIAKAPYQYNAEQKLYFTYDDKRSIALKTRYAIDQKLDGIMFWELTCDLEQDGLLDEISKVKNP